MAGDNGHSLDCRDIAPQDVHQTGVAFSKKKLIKIDGHDFEAIENALVKSRNSDKATIIIAKTKIGKGAATLEGSHHTHGAPLGSDEIKQSKIKAGFDPEASFVVSEDVKNAFDKTESGELLSKAWDKMVKKDLPP